MTALTTGSSVPDLELQSTTGPLNLAHMQGRALVLYFYPKDNTPGCTTQSQNFRDAHADFTAAGATVVGVSRDSLKSHQSFCEKQGLPFTLVSDPDETLCNLFGVMKMKNMYGKQVRGVERSTFLIGRDGRIAQEWRGVKVPGHVQAVLEAVRAF
ncbi:peroxiredoxin [Verticiella sediminum]|uniref:thioredoxin-dependent peroxiredoxin n=1 Tax=Verticiella sediminum TaxID=1247510 RepID=A0A556ABI7_9BURK|nr:peroxiredoxin [Verticiella sediminum]TSH90266.1 peroxiredoxin [Verticiella sediminum]